MLYTITMGWLWIDGCMLPITLCATSSGNTLSLIINVCSTISWWFQFVNWSINAQFLSLSVDPYVVPAQQANVYTPTSKINLELNCNFFSMSLILSITLCLKCKIVEKRSRNYIVFVNFLTYFFSFGIHLPKLIMKVGFSLKISKPRF